jgi:hypothetical protein
MQDSANSVPINFTIDLTTTNISFIKMYKILKDLGISNNKFFLILYDSSLQGIDPHNPLLSPEIQARIAVECRRNIWYFLREVVRIPVAGGHTKYKLNRGNLALTWCMINNFNAIEMLPRQNFKTVSALCNYVWFYRFATTNSKIYFGNKEFDDSKLNISRFKDIDKLLPSYLIPISKKDDVDNIIRIKSGVTLNEIIALPSAMDGQKADKIGRGLTSPLLWWDEFAFLKFNDIIYSAAAPAQSQAMLEAKTKGKPYGKLITTTPNMLDLPQGKFCKKMIENACPFDEKFYDLPIEKVEKIIDANSQNDFVYIEFSWKQLGRTKEWFKKQCKDLNNDLLKIKREVLLQWTYAQDNSPFTEEQIEAISNYVIQDSCGKIYLNGVYMLNIIKEIKNFSSNWLVGIDIAGGLGRDNTALSVVHPTTLEVHAEMKYSTMDTHQLLGVILDLHKFLPNSVLFIERNSMGLGVIDSLLAVPSIAKFIYWEKRKKEAEKKVGLTKIKQKVQTKVYGINTDKKSRERMIDLLRHIVNEQPECITSPNIFEDIKNLEIKKTGKVEHREGEHDDSLFSYLIIRYAIAYGTNIANFIYIEGTELTPEKVEQHRRMAMELLHTANNPGKKNLGMNIIEDEQEKHFAASQKDNLMSKIYSLNN